MYSVTISGFKSKEEVEEFFNWYGGQGEQDFGCWLDHQDIKLNFAPVNLKEPFYSHGNQYYFSIITFYK